MPKKEETLLRVTEVIDTSKLVAKRRYSTYLVANRGQFQVDKVIWDNKGDRRSNIIYKTIYVKLLPEDMDVDDLTKTKAFFRAKLSLRLAGDKA